jgi:hypothetical protein
MSTKTAGFLLLLGLTGTTTPAQDRPNAHAQALRNPDLHFLYHYDVSRSLREMPVIPPLAEEGEWRLHPVKLIRPPRAVPRGWVDPLARAGRAAAAVAPQVATTPGLSFDGVGVGLGSFSPTGAPPDPNGAPGATQYVQWVNTSFAVFDKSTGALVYGPAAGNTLWQGFGGPCETTNSGDPVVMYDKAANRWVMTQFSINQSGGQFFQCVAVSTSADATGTYRRFAYNFSGFNDYPKGGVWPDGYYLTFNMFNSAGTAFLGARVCALDRNQMITASGTPGPIQCFQLSTTYGGLLPADLDGATPPPAGSPNYMVAFDDVNNNGLNLWRFHVDWTNSANSTLTGPTKITTAAFSPACGGGTCIPQPSTTQQLDSLADRLMFRLAYRNFGSYESLVVNHSVTVGSTASGVRWYEVRSPGSTPTLFQSGTFSPDATSRWMGSIAQDQQGNMLLGYSVSSSSVRPGIRYTGRLVSDAPGTMQAESTLTTGVGSQTGGLSRWGDYSAMTIDPVDDCTFWYTNQYLKTTGSFNWSTRIGSFKFPSCGSTTPDFTIAASPSSLSIVQGASGTSTVTVTSVNGFASAVGLSCTGLPAGVTCSFNPGSVTPAANGSATSTLTVSVSASTAASSYSFQVTGTSGSLSHGAPISLTVTPAGGGGGPQTAVYDATLKAPKCAVVGSACDSGPSLLLGRDGKGPEPNQPNTINSSCADGTSGTFHSDESNDRLKVSTLDGADFAAGKTVKVDATVWAWTTPSADHLDLYYAANAASPAWTFIGTLTPTAAGAQVLSATYTLPSGSLQAVRAQFRYQGSASACTSGSYNDHDDIVFAVSAPPPPPPDFTVSVSPSNLTIAQGTSGTSTATVTSLNGFNSAVSLSCTGLPAGATCAFSPASATPPANGTAASALTVSVDAGTATGSYPVSVVGTGGATTHTAALSLTVTPPGGGPQVATYDATLRAPKCAAVGSSCDSGSSLLLGRDGRGPEPNQPNTINSSCADGTSGTFHADESNDRLKVSTVDGTSFTAGKTVRIDATVWAWTTPSLDHLDLYYAANATSPTWTFIATLTPTAAGAQTLSATYTLPAGPLQAVRAQFRYQGSASACTSGSYNDHDDLVFAVP